MDLPPNNQDALSGNGERAPLTTDPLLTFVYVMSICAILATVILLVAIVRHKEQGKGLDLQPPAPLATPTPSLLPHKELDDETARLLRSQDAEEVRKGTMRALLWLMEPPLGTEPTTKPTEENGPFTYFLPPLNCNMETSATVVNEP